MKTPLAVIVGAGVAGLAAAWWLQHIGWRTIIVERFEGLRDSGYMIGLSGPGYDTVTRMDLLPLLQSVSYEINENVYRDRRGKEILRLRYRDFLRGLPYLAIRRLDLVSVMVSQPQGESYVYSEEPNPLHRFPVHQRPGPG